MKTLYSAAALTIVLLGSFSFIKAHKQVPGRTHLLSDTTALPDSYTKRHFLAVDGGMDASSIPGNIVKYDPSTQLYGIITMTGLVKGHATAAMQKPDNGLIYQGQITSTDGFNGSNVINGLKAADGQVIDIQISDDIIYSVPPGMTDTTTIKSTAKSLTPADRKNYYYITAVTVTTLSYKIHPAETVVDKVNKKAAKASKKLDELAHNDTAKNGVYLKATPPKSNAKMPGSYSAGNTKMLTDKTISIQLTSVDDFIR